MRCIASARVLSTSDVVKTVPLDIKLKIMVNGILTEEKLTRGHDQEVMQDRVQACVPQGFLW